MLPAAPQGNSETQKKCLMMAALVLSGAGMAAAVLASQDAHGRAQHSIHEDAEAHLEQMAEKFGMTAEQKQALVRATRAR